MTDPLDKFRISVSKSKSFDSCKKQYKFNYIEKLPQKEWAHLTYGKFIHKVLEDFHNFYLNNTDSITPANEVMALAYKAAQLEFKGKMNEEHKKEAYASICSYLAKIENDAVIKQKPKILSCEQQFGIIIDDKILLNGFIDRVQIDPDGVLTVIDYKTTKDKKYLKNDWFQLMTYAFVLMIDDPSIQTVRGGYMLIRHNFAVLSKDFDREEVMKIKDKFLEYADKIKEEKLWRANPTFLCKYCSFLDNCKEGKQQVYKHNVFGETNWD